MIKLMRKRRRRKYITIHIFVKDEEVYINGGRVDELKELKILDICREDIYKEVK